MKAEISLTASAGSSRYSSGAREETACFTIRRDALGLLPSSVTATTKPPFPFQSSFPRSFDHLRLITVAGREKHHCNLTGAFPGAWRINKGGRLFLCSPFRVRFYSSRDVFQPVSHLAEPETLMQGLINKSISHVTVSKRCRDSPGLCCKRTSSTSRWSPPSALAGVSDWTGDCQGG